MSDNNFEENPYLSARKEYSDRYGSSVKDAARWRQISILMVMLCIAFCFRRCNDVACKSEQSRSLHCSGR